MTDLEIALIRLGTDLTALKARWAVVGGWAVTLRAEPRTTRDLDVTVAVANDREAEKLIVKLRDRYYGFRPDSIIEQTAVGRLATVRLLSPAVEDEVVVDLLFASSGIENEVVAAATSMEVLPNHFLPVAVLGHLLALKVLAGRTQDLADIETLLRYADKSDLKIARDALELIRQRGYDRGKDLLAEFSRWL